MPDDTLQNDAHIIVTPKVVYFEQLLAGSPHEQLSSLFSAFHESPLQFYQRTFWLNEYLRLNTNPTLKEAWISAIGVYIQSGAFRQEIAAIIESLVSFTDEFIPYYESTFETLAHVSERRDLDDEEALRLAAAVSALLFTENEPVDTLNMIHFTLNQESCATNRECIVEIYEHYRIRVHESVELSPQQAIINAVLEQRVHTLTVSINTGESLNPLELRVARSVGL